MNKTVVGFLMVFLLCFAFFGTANAALIDIGSGIVQDNRGTAGDASDDIYWLQNLSAFNGQTYSAQKTAIEGVSITVGGDVWDDWKMAGLTEMQALWSNTDAELAGMFTHTYFDEGFRVWYGRYDSSPVTTSGQHFTAGLVFSGFNQSLSEKNLETDSILDDHTEISADNWAYGAWAYMTLDGGDEGNGEAPVPEPATMLLFGIGLLGVAGISRKKTP